MAEELIFGFDIGKTSIGSAVVRMDSHAGTGEIVHLGTRIFPEARDFDGVPLNQERRKRRMMRRQLRRRRARRRALNHLLHEAGLLPDFNMARGSEWSNIMDCDPWELRSRAITGVLSSLELGRAIYHLAQRRHFRGRDLDGTALEADGKADTLSGDEQRAASRREKDRSALTASGKTLGAFIAAIPARAERRRGYHFSRNDVVAEFHSIVAAQSEHEPMLRDANFVAELEQVIFDQKQVFWRKATLGQCRFIPGAELAASSSWIAQEKRLFEKLNNLRIEEGNGRHLDGEERAALLALLRKQDTVTWGGIRRYLKLYWRRHGLAEKPTFNLERGGEKGLVGNRLENRLAAILGDRWDTDRTLRERMRLEIHARLYAADYGQIGGRIVIRREAERRQARAEERIRLRMDFDLTEAEADKLTSLSFATGWEPFSNDALWRFLPRLQQGVAFGALLSGPEEEGWRASTFPEREKPTRSWVDRLPTPGNSREEIERQKSVRNPTVLRVQNELRKVVNNLVVAYGKPNRVRVEVAREVGKSARERVEDLRRNRAREKEREKAVDELRKAGIDEPSRNDVEKWLLWQECNRQCPYTGQMIDFAALFDRGEFQVEHIWPRWQSLDDSYANKTLCHRDFKIRKSNLTPFEAFKHDETGWLDAIRRVNDFSGPPKRVAMKVKRFAATEIPADFAARQWTDTGYATRQAVGFLEMLFPDLDQAGEVSVATLSGRVTSRLRHNWGLHNILEVAGQTTRSDHRHHAIDALVVALAHPKYAQRLSRWFQKRDAAGPGPIPPLEPPFPDVRAQAQKRLANIVVSHRVRRKVSGPLHKDTIYSDGGPAEGRSSAAYRWFVTRKPVEALTRKLLSDDAAWPNPTVRDAIRAWVEANGGDCSKAFAKGYPTVSEGGAPIRKVRIRVKQQQKLMAPLKNGYADLGKNHHVAVFQHADGRIETEIVSLFKAADRVRRHQCVTRKSLNGAPLVMSLAQGDTVSFPTGELRGFWIVQEIWSAGPIVLWRAEDATGSSVFRPTAASVLKSSGRKVSVDPIGRIRPARD